jgi:hypothetical protein
LCCAPQLKQTLTMAAKPPAELGNQGSASAFNGVPVRGTGTGRSAMSAREWGWRVPGRVPTSRSWDSSGMGLGSMAKQG